MTVLAAPVSIAALLERANALAGITLADLAQQCELTLPKDFQTHKGWLGQLLEAALGAATTAGAGPDFPELQVELKTVPVNSKGQPIESTFVCAVPAKLELHWHQSLVWRKLQRVLWIPIGSAKTIPERQVGQAILWQPTVEQEQLLQQDWEELMEMLALGYAEQLTARYGEVLQIRPKAAHARVLQTAFDAEGESIMIVPRGFYLRPHFTAQIISTHIPVIPEK